MGIDASIYQNLRPVQVPDMMAAATGAANLSRMAKLGQREDEEAAYTDRLRKASEFGGALDGLAGLKPEERAAQWGKVHGELVGRGILKPGEAPAEYDDGFFRQSLSRYYSTKDGIEARLKGAQIKKLEADAINDPADKALDRDYKRSQIAKNLADAKGNSSGQRLPADKVLAVSEGQRLPQMLDDIRGTLKANKGAFGPIRGGLSSMNPYNEQAQTIDAQMRTAAQSFGRLMEGGVLRKEDEEKYRKMFPQLKDDPAVAENKLALVDRMLKQKQQADVSALAGSGYDTGAFGQGGAMPDLPGVLRSGARKEGVAVAGDRPGAKPTTVIQNGHTYTLNPKTGNYE
jgi:hypothetical protein